MTLPPPYWPIPARVSRRLEKAIFSLVPQQYLLPQKFHIPVVSNRRTEVFTPRSPVRLPQTGLFVIYSCFRDDGDNKTSCDGRAPSHNFVHFARAELRLHELIELDVAYTFQQLNRSDSPWPLDYAAASSHWIALQLPPPATQPFATVCISLDLRRCCLRYLPTCTQQASKDHIASHVASTSSPAESGTLACSILIKPHVRDPPRGSTG